MEESYPEVLALTSTKEVYESFFFILGIYKRIPDIENNGKPVWKHYLKHFYLYYDVISKWMIGPEYTKTLAMIINKNLGPVPLQDSQWLYLNWTNYEFDDSLKFTEGGSSYPEIISIYEVDTSDKQAKSLVGNYTKVLDRLHNNKPVWKNNENNERSFLFCSDSVWTIGQEVGGFENTSSVYGWNYWDNNIIWPPGNILYIVGYPSTFKISSEGGAAEFYPEYMGVYKILPEEYLSGKPVWIHESNQVYFFNNDCWNLSPSLEDFFQFKIENNCGRGSKKVASGESFFFPNSEEEWHYKNRSISFSSPDSFPVDESINIEILSY